MYDHQLIQDILIQIDNALEKISNRASQIHSVGHFTDSEWGMEKLDSICMLFIAVGEAIKNIDKMTNGNLHTAYPEIDWKGVMGFRDIIAHHYFDVDAEQVFWICKNEIQPLQCVIQQMISDLCL